MLSGSMLSQFMRKKWEERREEKRRKISSHLDLPNKVAVAQPLWCILGLTKDMAESNTKWNTEWKNIERFQFDLHMIEGFILEISIESLLCSKEY